MAIAKIASRIPHGWESESGITPEVHTICDRGIAILLCESIEQGLPLSVALDMAGIPQESYRSWSRSALTGKTPEAWCITMVRKAQASHIYNNLLELNVSDGNTWRKYLEILKLRDPDNWGGTGNSPAIDEDFGPDFL